MDPDELAQLLTLDDRAPSKSWAQVLEENPDHAGGLAQLAEAERQAKLYRVSPNARIIK